MTQLQVMAFLKLSKKTVIDLVKKGFIPQHIRDDGRLLYKNREILHYALNPPTPKMNRFPNKSREEIIYEFNQAITLKHVVRDKERIRLRRERDQLNQTTAPLHKYPICKNQILRMYKPRLVHKITDEEIDLLLTISDKEFFTIDTLDMLYPMSGIIARKMIEKGLIIPILKKSDILTISPDMKVIVRNLFDCIYHNKKVFFNGKQVYDKY